MHLTCDGQLRTWGYPWGFDKAQSQGYLSRWLLNMPDRIGMTAIAPPIAVWSGETLHGVQIIAESHITVELHMDVRRAFVDIFTCKGFDTDLALDIITRELAMDALNIRRIHRGLEYGTELQ